MQDGVFSAEKPWWFLLNGVATQNAYFPQNDYVEIVV